ncbi:MAG: IMP cyclohydrolase [Bacillota bacterium]|nr:IMP cyclohydrolase [Bacillota bacterium]
MRVYTIEELLSGNSYPGRGVLLGLSPDGKKAVAAYFIMGRSVNSRNRIFLPLGDDLQIRPFDESLVSDPSLIIYSPLRVWKDQTIVTNGDQTDTVYEGFEAGLSFEDALMSRCYEPDEPNFTPRISGLLSFDGGFSYRLSILKRENENGACGRYCYRYEPSAGFGHLIHTYQQDGNPLPTFTGEPECLQLCDDIDELSSRLWKSLDPENKISLAVRYIDLESGSYTQRIINKQEEVPA